MGNICQIQMQQPAKTSFPESFTPVRYKQLSLHQYLPDKQIETINQDEYQQSVVKGKVSNLVQSSYPYSRIGKESHIHKMYVVPPSEHQYGKFEGLQFMSQAPSQFFNQHNMSVYFKSGNSQTNRNSHVFSFRSGNAQSKLQKIQQWDQPSTGDFYLNPIRAEQSKRAKSQSNRQTKSHIKTTQSTQEENPQKIANKSAIQCKKTPKENTLELKHRVFSKNNF